MTFRKPKVSFFSKMKLRESERVILSIAQKFADQMEDDVVSQSLLLGLRNNTLHLFPEFCPAIGARLSLNDLRWYRSILALRSKSDDVNLGIDRDAAAWESYCKSEISCSQTNRRLRYQTWDSLVPGATEIILIARRKISAILGDCPDLEDLQCKFGPGANVSCRKKTTARHKLSATLGCSIEGIKSIPRLEALYPRLFANREVVVETAEVSMVPKNAKTSRTIELQPLLNTFVQLGIGSYMKRKMVQQGINLYDQSINRLQARRASLPDSSLATVDWSSASDTICTWLVWELFDPYWFDLLSNWRCGTVRYPAKSLQFNLEKFSAMGNGYTFELESIIFYALAFAVCTVEGVGVADLSIYGDDLIVPSIVKDRLLSVFSFCGFSVNDSKSFWEGPFRESCGADFFLGVNVRPTYIKGRLTPARIVRLHNEIFRSGEYEIARFIGTFVPNHLRLYGPDGYGDGHLIGSEVLVKKHDHRLRGFGGGCFYTFTKRPKRDCRVEVPGDHLLPGYNMYLRENVHVVSERESDPYVLRGGEVSRRISVYVLG